MTIRLQKRESSLSLSNTQKKPSLGKWWKNKRLLLKQYRWNMHVTITKSVLTRTINILSYKWNVACLAPKAHFHVALPKMRYFAPTKAYRALHPKRAFVSNDQMKACPSKGISYTSLHAKWVNRTSLKTDLTRYCTHESKHEDSLA
jgi:hypothetical protein